MLATLLAIALIGTNPPAWGDWREVRDADGRLLSLRWIDAEGNLHHRFPLGRFPGSVDARQWTPAKTATGEMCWAIRTDEWVQTWQPRDARGRKWSSVEEFVRSDPTLPHAANYGVTPNMVARSAMRAQAERPGRTAQGNGPLTPDEYDAAIAPPPSIAPPPETTPSPFAGLIALAALALIPLVIALVSRKSPRNTHDGSSDEHELR